MSSSAGNMTASRESASDDSFKLIVTSFCRSRAKQNGDTSGKNEAFIATSHSQSTALTTLLYSIAYPHRIASHDLVPLELLQNGQYGHKITQSIYAILQPLPDFSNLRHHEAVVEYEHHHNSDIVFDITQSPESGGWSRPLKLALFDMDSTLINEEVIDELARSIGISDAVSAITARAMNGDIDFATSLKERVAMLNGVKSNVWTDLRRTVTIAEGARELVGALRRRGVLTGVISGGFMPMADWLKEELGLDYAFANHLMTTAPNNEHPYEHLSGVLSPDHPIITPELKRETLIALATAHQITLSETMAVGDGSNDLLMLGAAGIGIACNAKEKVQNSAPMRLNGPSLADLLCLLGPGTLE